MNLYHIYRYDTLMIFLCVFFMNYINEFEVEIERKHGVQPVLRMCTLESPTSYSTEFKG
jgi:hypothetical protein